MADEHHEVGTTLVQKFEGSNSGKVGRLEELLRFIDSKYVDDVNEEDLINAATEAIFDQLDPHSVYIPPNEITKINQRMSGYYNGVGVETILYNDTMRVTKIMDNSPAHEAGVSFGDKIIKIKDTIVAGVKMPKEDQWALMKVEKDELLNLQIIRRNGTLENIEIEPSRIQYPNVDYFYVGDVAYINVEKFSDDTYEGIVKALEYFQKDKIIPSLIIDLRNNPGGYLQEATKILNQLFEQDKRLLVYTKGKSKKSENKTTGRPFYRVEKLAVLINRNSASASEIIAGAIQDWDQGIIVGEPSYGKGLVQDQFDLTNGGSIRLTTARYFTPTGRYIQTPYDIDQLEDTVSYLSKIRERPLIAQGGISPDYELMQSDEEIDALNIIQGTIASESFDFIVRNNLQYGEMPNFESAELTDALYQKTTLFQQDYNIKDEEAIQIFDRNLRSEIFKQLGFKDESRQAKFADDLFVLKAKEVLEYKDIFADFVDLSNVQD